MHSLFIAFDFDLCILTKVYANDLMKIESHIKRTLSFQLYRNIEYLIGSDRF